MGPRMDPWGTPSNISFISDTVPLTSVFFFFIFYFRKGQLYKEMNRMQNRSRNKEPPIHIPGRPR